MTVRELVEKNRSIRIFKPSPAPTRAQLESWVEVARQAASGGNLQALKYFLSADPPPTQDFPHPALGGLSEGLGPRGKRAAHRLYRPAARQRHHHQLHD
jgi:hypothetical protein